MKTPAIISFHCSLASGLRLVAREKPAYAMVMTAKKTASVFRLLAIETKSNATLPPAYAAGADEVLHHERGEPDYHQAYDNARK